MSHETDDTSGSYHFGNSHHLQYHGQQHHAGYYPSTSFHHQLNPPDNGYQRSTCLYPGQPVASNHHVIQQRTASNPSISSPSPSPNSSNSNSSYAGFGHHHPAGYSYHGSVAHHSNGHQQLATSHHHLTAGGNRYVHHPFARHHPSAAVRVSVSTPPCLPHVTDETLNSVHHNQLHHHSHLLHPSTSQLPPPAVTAGPAGPLIKSKRGQFSIFKAFFFINDF